MSRQHSIRWLGCAVACASLVTMVAVRAQGGAPGSREWPYVGGDLANSKYSPMDQINRDNFSRLKMAWRWTSADGFLSMTDAAGGEWSAPSSQIFDELQRTDPKRWRDNKPPTVSNMKATPVMVDGVLYLNTPTSQSAAIDARTGRTLWVYNPKSYEKGTVASGPGWDQRGLAYWKDPVANDARILFGTGDGYLICVAAKTGRPCTGFGSNGRVDLMEGLPHATRGARERKNRMTYSVKSPPIVVRDVVITSASMNSDVMEKEGITGWIRGFDVRTGRIKWVFHTAPRPGEFGNDTWGNDSWSFAGKVTVWTSMSADEELGYVYLPTNTVAPDYYGGYRPGNNLFAESVVCLDVTTGKRVWHFQHVHHGLWDYDTPAAPNLLDITVNGRRIKALAQVTKQGFVFVFDRVTGAPVWPIEERPVPPSDVPGEQASPTQPFPTKPPPFSAQGTSINDLVDFTPEIRRMAIEAVKHFRLGPLYTPQTMYVEGVNHGTIMRPAALGGASWWGAAVDPETGILYVPSYELFSVITLDTPKPEDKSNLRVIHRVPPTKQPVMPQGLPLFKPPYSRLTAIDLNVGEQRWMVPTGDGDRIRNHPLLKQLNLPPLGGDAGGGGPLLTKTVLITTLTTGGTDGGPRMVARDKLTGTVVASVDLPAGSVGSPMTYMLDGKQYIALTVGGDVGELLAFTLP